MCKIVSVKTCFFSQALTPSSKILRVVFALLLSGLILLFLSVHVSKGKPDLNTSLPVRQTASIFKQPVTKVTNHPNNKVKTDPQKAVDQPRQVNFFLLLTRCRANQKGGFLML